MRPVSRTPDPDPGLLRSWMAVHDVRAGSALLLAGVVVGLVAGGFRLERVGPVALAAPTPVVLLLTAVHAGAAAVLATRTTDASLERLAARASTIRWWRLGWVATATALAATAAGLTAWSVGADHRPVVCNVAFLSALSLLVLAVGHAQLVWVPPVALLLVAVLFGGRDSGQEGFQAWASVLSTDVTAARVIGSGGSWLVAAVCCVWGSTLAARVGLVRRRAVRAPGRSRDQR